MSYYLTEMGAAGDETTIVLGGELDMQAAPALRDALRRAIEQRVDLICTNRNVLRTVEIAGLERHLADASPEESKGVRRLDVAAGA